MTSFENLTYKKILPIEQDRVYFSAPKMSLESISMTENNGAEQQLWVMGIIFFILVILVVISILIYLCNIKIK